MTRNRLTGQDAVAAVWAGVDMLLERADSSALAFHRLESLAARRLRLLGREVPADLVETERLGLP